MIKANQFGLGDFKLVESSEQGMLAQVERAIAAKRAIVFFGWEPHPMNTRFEMRYLTGGDASFGPNFGGATVFTNVRAGYLRECPNVGRLLRNLKFSLRGESEVMAGILDRKLAPEAAAAEWLEANPERAGRLVRRRHHLRRQAGAAARRSAATAGGARCARLRSLGRPRTRSRSAGGRSRRSTTSSRTARRFSPASRSSSADRSTP